MHHSSTPSCHCLAVEIDAVLVALGVVVSASATIASLRRLRCGEREGLGDSIVDRMPPRGNCKESARSRMECLAHRDETFHC